MRPNIPQLVYNLALKRDLAGLRRLQAKGYCLTQFHYAFHHEFNAIAKLAFDGHGDAAEFLVDHLIGNVQDLIQGYAGAGNVESTLHWLSHGGSIETAIGGLAYSGQHSVVERLISNSENTSLREWAISGFAKGQNDKLLRKFINDHYSVDILNKNTSNISEAQRDAIRYAVFGYAFNANNRGLELCEQFEVENYFYYFSICSQNFAIESIPVEYQFSYLEQLACFAYDEKIHDHLAKNQDQNNDNLKIKLLHAYYHGGHHPTKDLCDFAQSLPFYETTFKNIDCSTLADFGEPQPIRSAISLLTNGDDDENSASSPYALLGLSRNPETRLREFLYIKNIQKSKRLYEVWTTNNQHLETTNDLPWEAIQPIHQVFHHTPLGFTIAKSLGKSYDLLFNAIDLIMVSLHQSPSVLNISLVVDLILSNLLGVTEPDAVKIHSHFAGVFSKHLTRLPNTQNTPTQGKKTHAPQHPAIGL